MRWEDFMNSVFTFSEVRTQCRIWQDMTGNVSLTITNQPHKWIIIGHSFMIITNDDRWYSQLDGHFSNDNITEFRDVWGMMFIVKDYREHLLLLCCIWSIQYHRGVIRWSYYSWWSIVYYAIWFGWFCSLVIDYFRADNWITCRPKMQHVTTCCIDIDRRRSLSLPLSLSLTHSSPPLFLSGDWRTSSATFRFPSLQSYVHACHI